MDQVKEFAKKYNLTLDIEEVENSILPAGTITKQSRPAESDVVEGIKLTITVTREPEVPGVVGDIIPEEDDEERE